MTRKYSRKNKKYSRKNKKITNKRKSKRFNKMKRFKGGKLPYFNLDILLACHCIADKRSSKLYTHYNSTIHPFDETEFNNVKYIDTNIRRCIQSSNQYTVWHSIAEQFDIVYAIHCPIYSCDEEDCDEMANEVYSDIFNSRILKPNGKLVIYARDEESLREVITTFNNYLRTYRLNPQSFSFIDIPFEDYTYNTPAIYSSDQPEFVIEIMKQRQLFRNI
jgi:hypothetical protein